MKKNYVIGTFCAALMALVPFGAFAQGSSSSNFSITPPPIADPVFNAGEGALRFSGLFISMEVPDTGMKSTGAGFNMVGRKAVSDSFAFNFSFGLMGLGSSMDTSQTSTLFGTTTTTKTTTDSTIMLMPLSGNIEFQAYKGPVFNTILFGGLAMNLMTMNMDMSSTSRWTGATSGSSSSFSTTTVTSVTSGVQIGVQMGWQLGDFHLDGFGMSTTQAGTATVNTSLGSFSSDIPAYTTSSFGADIKYIPWNLSLSAMLQDAKKSEEQSSTPGQPAQTGGGFKSRVITLSWSSKF